MSTNISHNRHDRIVVLVDMDCFYCQVEEQLNPRLRGKPIAVVQYNAWQGGGIIAVNYPARERGVTRHMRGDQATEHCPDIELVRVPNVREKADLSKYRDAGREVALVLQTFTPLLERASVDEAYLDITQNVATRLDDMDKGLFSVKPEMLVNTYALGYDNIGKFVQTVAARLKANGGGADEADDGMNNDVKLLIGATIVNEIRAAVKAKTGYECSAGIGHNKILAKLVCGINKPNKQTLLPITHVAHLYSAMPVRKLTGLGGKFGEEVCAALNITKMSELAHFTLDELQRRFDEKNGLWLFSLSRGFDLDPVTPKFTSKSIGCCKKFPGRNAIKGIATLQHWMSELAQEIFERIAKDESENNRRPRQMVVSYIQKINGAAVNSTRSVPLATVDVAQMAADAWDVIRRNTTTFLRTDQPTVLNDPIVFLGLTVTKFEDLDKGAAAAADRNSIATMFSKQAKQQELRDARTIEEESQNLTSVGVLEIADENQSANSSCLERDVHEFDEDPVINPEKCTTDVIKCQPQMPFFSKKASPDTTMKLDSLDESAASSTTLEVANESEPNDIAYLNETLVESPPRDTIHPPIGQNYQESYAEFQLPAKTIVATERCGQCNRKVPLTELQSHADAHFAFQLSQEQRVEFRQNLAKNFVARQPSAKRPKLSSPSSAKKVPSQIVQSKLIHQFLVKPDATVPDDTDGSSSSGGPKVACAECGRLIAIDGQLEHADYHTALRLQKELNGQQQQQQVQRIAMAASSSGASSSVGSAKKEKSSVASYFKRSAT